LKTILLVDDEYAVVEILATLLADEGYAVLTASDGQEALDIVAEKLPDAIVTDQMMPVMDGAEMFRQLQRSAKLRSIPAVLMSSAPMAPGNSKLPWALFLQKPFEFDELLAWLRAYVGKSR
jgi:CheY-like chemotaxis protein